MWKKCQGHLALGSDRRVLGLVGGGPPFLPAQEDGVTAGRGWGLGVGAGRTGAHSRGRPRALPFQHSLLHMLGQAATQSQPQQEERVSSKHDGAPTRRPSVTSQQEAGRVEISPLGAEGDGEDRDSDLTPRGPVRPGVREQVAEVRICLSHPSMTATGITDNGSGLDSEISKSKKGLVFRKHVFYIKEGKLHVPERFSSEPGHASTFSALEEGRMVGQMSDPAPPP